MQTGGFFADIETGLKTVYVKSNVKNIAKSLKANPQNKFGMCFVIMVSKRLTPI